VENCRGACHFVIRALRAGTATLSFDYRGVGTTLPITAVEGQ
jgi:hypothetical protein